MMAEELVELTAAIQHELELARSGDGYEEAAVAGEIVERMVAPMLAARDASFDQRLSNVQEEYRKAAESWDRARVRLTVEGRVLLWLHAEAAWHRDQLDNEALKWTELAGQCAEKVDRLTFELAATRGKLGEAQGNHWAALEGLERVSIEVNRLRREVEFEARGDRNFYRQGFDAPPPCSCVTDPRQLIDAGWVPPQCAVHPGNDAAPGPLHPEGSTEGHFRSHPQTDQRAAESTPECAVHPDGDVA